MKDLGITTNLEVKDGDCMGLTIVELGDFDGSLELWHHWGDGTKEQADGRAKLFADAGNTANKCGLLPSELLEYLENIIDAQFNPGKSLANLNSTISAAKEAIKKCTL